jgi:hypothetical protein
VSEVDIDVEVEFDVEVPIRGGDTLSTSKVVAVVMWVVAVVSFLAETAITVLSVQVLMAAAMSSQRSVGSISVGIGASTGEGGLGERMCGACVSVPVPAGCGRGVTCDSSADALCTMSRIPFSVVDIMAVAAEPTSVLASTSALALALASAAMVAIVSAIIAAAIVLLGDIAAAGLE